MTTYEIETQTRTGQPTAVMRATLPVDGIGPWLAQAFGGVIAALGAQGTEPAGPPFARFHRLDEGRFEVEAGFPATAPIDDAGAVIASSLPAGPAACTTHIGPYEDMEPAYAAIAEWMAARDLEPAGDPWEVYFSDPAAEPDPATWRTDVVAPYREP